MLISLFSLLTVILICATFLETASTYKLKDILIASLIKGAVVVNDVWEVGCSGSCSMGLFESNESGLISHSSKQNKESSISYKGIILFDFKHLFWGVMATLQ